MPTIADNLHVVQDRIAAAAERSGRPPSAITLVAVSKTRTLDEVSEAIDAGATHLGENYLQEAVEKIQTFPDSTWHMIGHLQSNKAKVAAEVFDVIQTVDSSRLADELAKRAHAAARKVDVLIEVGISEEETKSGIAPEHTLALADHIMGLDGLRLRGLMGMPPWLTDPDELRPYFVRLHELFERLPEDCRDTLSIGMSDDFEIAIEEGSTMVRVGTAIFGPRTPRE